MKIFAVALLALLLASGSGCHAVLPTHGERNGFVAMEVQVEVVDTDGTLFDLENSERTFSFGTIARVPMVRVVVVAPKPFAGRRYLILLPAAPITGQLPPGLMIPGTKIAVGLPVALLANGPRQGIDFEDLKWPDR